MVFHKNHCEAVSREQKSKRLIIDFNILIPDSGYWNPDSLPVGLGFWIPIVSGIPDSLCCIPDSKTQDFRCHKQNSLKIRIPHYLKFPGFRNPE